MENKKIILKDDYTTEIGGLKMSWFIGDINWSQADRLGLLKWENPSKQCGAKLLGEGAYWEAFAKFNNRIYQMSAYYNCETKELSDFYVSTNDSSYFNKENYEILINNPEIKKLIKK